MILIRDIFHLKFGKAKDAKALLAEARNLFSKPGQPKPKAMTDLSGPFYTLVMETEWKSLSDMENSMKEAFVDTERQAWYQKFVPLVDSGSREIYTILE